MATAFSGSHPPATNQPTVNKYFSDLAWQRMLAEDASAFKAVAIVLSAVVTIGFAAMVTTVLLVL